MLDFLPLLFWTFSPIGPPGARIGEGNLPGADVSEELFSGEEATGWDPTGKVPFDPFGIALEVETG